MSLDFYQDQPHSCSYLTDRLARNIYPDPSKPVTKSLYSHLIQHGFRRSGDHVYRPFCDDCQACIPVRIDVNKFKPNRSQKRCLKRNAHVTLKMRPAEFNEEHYALYSRYQTIRHSGGGMDNPTKETYSNFLLSNWADTGLIEFREADQLIGVAVTDFVRDGLSAFYTFFDPEMSSKSLGTLSILKQIEIAKTYDLSWLYLGYWIEDSPKMSYKKNFSALQTFDEKWTYLNKNFE